MKYYKVIGRTDQEMYFAATNKKEALEKFKASKGDIFDTYITEPVAKKDLPKDIAIALK